MTIATIDIGTNTVLLLVAKFSSTRGIQTLAYEQRVPRLGRGVDAERRLHPDAMERVITVLKEYRSIMASYSPESAVVAGTSAVRDASNRDDFCRLVQEKTGFELQVLSGEEEAYWTYRGAISGVPGLRRATVLDIGGGSTEISTGTLLELESTTSVDIGSVRLTERFFAHDPPMPAELASATEMVRAALLGSRGARLSDSTLVGVAGTATSLAVLAQGAKAFLISAVTNYRLERRVVERLLRQLRSMPSGEIRKLSSVLEGREDVLTAGTLILLEVMDLFEFEEMIVSERGVRYGIALREWERVTKNQ